MATIGLPQLVSMFERLQQALQEADLATARKLINQLRLVELPRKLSQYLDILAAQALQLQTQPDDARRLLQRVLAEAVDDGIRAFVYLTLGNQDLRTLDVTDETIATYSHAADLARAAGDTGVEADALFNIAAIVLERDAYDEARTLLLKARALYASMGRESQRLDCDHLLATLPRISGEATDAALEAERAVLEEAIAMGDWTQIARVAGDLARSYYWRQQQGDDGALAQAAQLVQLVDMAEDEAWATAGSAPNPKGARIEAATLRFNNFEIARSSLYFCVNA